MAEPLSENEKIIDLEYRINYYPSLKKLITIVQKSSPEITEAEIRNVYNKYITTHLTTKTTAT